MSDLTRYRGSGEWSALYVNGNLDQVGDHYVIDERISEIAGVTVIHSDAFIRGGDQRENVAPDLDTVNNWEEDREAARRKVVELRAQSANALREAARLEMSLK